MSFSRDQDMTWWFFVWNRMKWVFRHHLHISSPTFHQQKQPKLPASCAIAKRHVFLGGAWKLTEQWKKDPWLFKVYMGLYYLGVGIPTNHYKDLYEKPWYTKDQWKLLKPRWRVFFLPWKVMTRGICWEYLLLASKNERVANPRMICYNQRPSSSPDCAEFHPCFIHIMVFPQAWSPRARAFQRGKSYGPSFFCVRLLVLLADIVFWHPSTEVFLSKRIG